MVIFNSYVSHYQRVCPLLYRQNSANLPILIQEITTPKLCELFMAGRAFAEIDLRDSSFKGGEAMQSNMAKHG